MRSTGVQTISKLSDLFLSTEKPFPKCQLRLYCLKSIPGSANLFARNDQFSIANALSVAEKSKSWLLGPQVHSKIIRCGLVEDVFSLNNLIKMYSKCGFLHNAIKVFEEMTERNLVSWTLMVSGAVQNGENGLGLEFYLEMARMGYRPNSFGLGSVLKGCADFGAYQFGMCVHGFAFKVGLDKDLYVGGSILNMYAKLEDIRSAKSVFNSLPSLDVGCWNAMIGGYVKCGHGIEALTIVCLMLRRGISMDYFTHINSLKSCSEVGNLGFGKLLHGLFIKKGAELSTSVMNCLMDMYFRLGEKNSAFTIFYRIIHKDIISWNIVFSHLFEDKDGKDITSLLREFMLGGITPNHITFSVLFRECGNVYDLNLGLQFFSLAMKFGLYDEVMVSNSIIYMFSRCKNMDKARKLFDILCFKDITAWNQLISGYCFNHCHTESLCIFIELCGLGVEPNEYTFTSILEASFESQNKEVFRHSHGAIIKRGFSSSGHLCSLFIKGYVKFGLLGDSFRFLKGSDRLDFVSYTTLISALIQEAHIYEGIRHLNGLMEAGEKPDEFIFGSILNYCANTSGYRSTKVVHSLIFKMGLETQVFVASGLIDAYAKSGDIDSAKMIYNASRDSNDVVIFNTMIMGYAYHGLITEAMEILKTMKLANLQPNQATFVSVISACSHMGLVDEGSLLFETIISDRKMEASRDVYGCVVDMLSRKGCLEKARRVIEEMPYAAWPEILRSFLNGCRIHGNKELGEWSAKILVHLAPENDTAYVLLSKVYSEIGSWEDVGKIRQGLMEQRVSKDTGCSWIEV